MKSKESTDIKKAKEKIKEADVIYITAGAGMGVDVDYLILEEMRVFGENIHY